MTTSGLVVRSEIISKPAGDGGRGKGMFTQKGHHMKHNSDSANHFGNVYFPTGLCKCVVCENGTFAALHYFVNEVNFHIVLVLLLNIYYYNAKI